VDLVLDTDSKKNVSALTTLSVMGEGAIPAINLLTARMNSTFSQSGYGTSLAPPRVPKGKSSIFPMSAVESYNFAKQYLSAIEAIKPDHPTIKATRFQLAKPTNLIVEHRFECLKSLIEGAGDEAEKKKLLPLVVVGLQQDSKHTLEYLEFVGQFGKLAATQLSALKKLKLSTNAAIRDAATKAADQIEADK